MTLEQLRARLQRMLVELFGAVSIDSDDDFFINFDSARVYVRALENRAGTLLAQVFAVVLSDTRLTPELYRWVATEGQEYYFGQMCVVEHDNELGSVRLDHYLLGEYLDLDELKYAVLCLGEASDTLDDELQARFGGQRFNER